jgi:hypothetical protein
MRNNPNYDRFKIELAIVCQNSTFDSGMDSLADKTFRELCVKYGIEACQEYLYSFAVHYHDNKGLIVAILSIIDHMETVISPYLLGIVIYYFFSTDEEIRDMAVRCVEGWNVNNVHDIVISIPILLEVSLSFMPTSSFLNDYIRSILEDFKYK